MNSIVSLEQIMHFGPKIILFLSIIISAWYGNGIIHKAIVQFGIKNKIDEKNINLIKKIIKIVIYFIGVLLVLSTFQNQLATMAKTMSVVTLGIGLALQKELSNVTSGMFIIFNKSFKINDYIMHKDFEGKIIAIDLSTTTLKHENNVILVPNYILHTSVVTIKNK